MHLNSHSWHSCTLRYRIHPPQSLWTAWTLECSKCHMTIQIGNKTSRFQEIRFQHYLPGTWIDFQSQDWILSQCNLPLLARIFHFDWISDHSTECQSTLLRIFNRHVLNSAGYCAYLTIDSERLGASALDGVWLRARVRNGGVWLRDEKVNVKNQKTNFQVVSTAHHSTRTWCAASWWITTVHIGNDGLDAIWALVLEGDC